MTNVRAAEVVLGSTDLAADLELLTARLGFRLVMIFPADEPQEAVVEGHGARLRLTTRVDVAPGAVVRLTCEAPERLAGGAASLISPGGIRVELHAAEATVPRPRAARQHVVTQLAGDAPWSVGRAGMHYRDLLPGRLGGAIIASHIRIPDGGPVPDLVHYHEIDFQLIFCCHGWVRLVYEDQGPPFVLRAGDCVIQPPRIRHRVLEASPNLQVVEVGLPARHLTLADHDLALPTPHYRPERDFGGQRFCRSEAVGAAWGPARLPGFEARETGVAVASGGVASVQVLRPAASAGPPVVTRHDAEVVFAFVLAGAVTLRAEGHPARALAFGDAFATPPGLPTALTDATAELELLEVALPAAFVTQLHRQAAPP